MRSSLVVLACASSIAIGCGGAGSAPAAEDALDASVDVALFEVEPEDAPADVANAADASGANDAAKTDAPIDVAPEAAPSPHVCPSAADPLDCSPGTGTGMGDQCADAPSCYLTLVQKAVRDQLNAHPTWFDYSGPGGCPLIKVTVGTFLDAVVADLSAQNLCVIRDPNAPDQEISVKHDNAFTENFALVSSAGCARYGSPIYTGYCAPAWW